jgi:broad specificity phosphatase PhoE
MQKPSSKEGIGLMTKMIIVRHAETEANVLQVWQGALDAPLTARGMLQVEHTARRIAELTQEHPLDHFYVSPLPRAQSPAAAIAAAIRLEPVIEPDLREFDLGDWEGRSFLELREVENLWNRWAADPAFAPPNGESPLSFGRRVQEAFARLAADHLDQTLLIVSHGGVISNILASWLGAGPGDWRNWEAHNCAISVIESSPASWQGVLVNDIAHLPPAARIEENRSVYQLDDG